MARRKSTHRQIEPLNVDADPRNANWLRVLAESEARGAVPRPDERAEEALRALEATLPKGVCRECGQEKVVGAELEDGSVLCAECLQEVLFGDDSEADEDEEGGPELAEMTRLVNDRQALLDAVGGRDVCVRCHKNKRVQPFIERDGSAQVICQRCRREMIDDEPPTGDEEEAACSLCGRLGPVAGYAGHNESSPPLCYECLKVQLT